MLREFATRDAPRRRDVHRALARAGGFRRRAPPRRPAQPPAAPRRARRRRLRRRLTTRRRAGRGCGPAAPPVAGHAVLTVGPCASRSRGARAGRATPVPRADRARRRPVALVRQLGHVDDVVADGAEAVVLDLERANARDVAEAIAGADAVVFAAGAGPGSGIARKDTVDRAAAGLLADGAEQAGVRRYVLVSSMGAGAPPPPGTDEVFAAYLVAKRAAELDLRTRDLDWTILRPGGLTDERPDGHGAARRLGPARLDPARRRRRGARRAAARAAARRGWPSSWSAASCPIDAAVAAVTARAGWASGPRRRPSAGSWPQRDRADEVLVAGRRSRSASSRRTRASPGANPLASVPSELVARQPVAVESNALVPRRRHERVPPQRCGAGRAARGAEARVARARACRRCRCGRPPRPRHRSGRCVPASAANSNGGGAHRRADPLPAVVDRHRRVATPGRRRRRRATSRRSTSGPRRCGCAHGDVGHRPGRPHRPSSRPVRDVGERLVVLPAGVVGGLRERRRR